MVIKLLLTVSVGASAFAATANWMEKIEAGADFRYRHEYIAVENTTTKKTDERHRQRLQARLKIVGEVNDNVKLGFRLATGAGEITSRNQTFTGASSNKSFGLDLAYFDWTFCDELSLTGGKVANPFIHPGKTGILFDTDLTMEGMSTTYNSKGLVVTASSFWLAERSSSADAGIVAAQAAYKFSFGDMALQFGAGTYGFSNVQNDKILVSGTGTSSQGNTVTGTGTAATYDFKYELTQAFAILWFNMAGMPSQFYVDYLSNADPTDNNQAYVAGIKIGKAKEKGQYSFGYDFRQVEKDAVLGALNDGDFNGGSTDGKGHRLSMDYAFAEKSIIGLSYFLNETGVTGTSSDNNRARIDLKFKL